MVAQWRIWIGVIGAVLAFGCGSIAWSDTSHFWTAVPSTATVLDLINECEINYTLKGEFLSHYEAMDCEEARRIEREVGPGKKFSVRQKNFVRIEYKLQSGANHDAKVDRSNLGWGHLLHAGDLVPVTYDPAKPDDARDPLNLRKVVVYAMLGVLGVVFMLIAAGVNVMALSGEALVLLVSGVASLFGGRRTEPETSTPEPLRTAQPSTRVRVAQTTPSAPDRAPGDVAAQRRAAVIRGPAGSTPAARAQFGRR